MEGDFVCHCWFLLHHSRYAKDFALRNKVIILSGALTYYSASFTGTFPVKNCERVVIFGSEHHFW